MVNFNDLKERVKMELSQNWEKIQSSDFYIQMKDRFDDLQPMAQRGVIIGVFLLVALLVFSFPNSYLNSAQENLDSFDRDRGLIQDMFHIVSEEQSIPSLPAPPDALSFKSVIENTLQNKSLAKEQITSVQAGDNSEVDINSSWIDGTVLVNLRQLNVAQIIEIGTELEKLNPAIRLWDMNIKANSKDSRYFDVIYKMAILRVSKEEPPPPTRGRRNRG